MGKGSSHEMYASTMGILWRKMYGQCTAHVSSLFCAAFTMWYYISAPGCLVHLVRAYLSSPLSFSGVPCSIHFLVVVDATFSLGYLEMVVFFGGCD